MGQAASALAVCSAFGPGSRALIGLNDAELVESSRELVSALYPGLSMVLGDGGGDLLSVLFSSTEMTWRGDPPEPTPVRSRERRFILL